MCDTVVALGKVTADGAVVFGKNSDREPNEAHHLVRIPAANHPPGSEVKCTYLEIPQVQRTYEVILAKPFWIWGAEMGVNEHGVAIGNEALFTRVPHEEGPNLTGMDLVRLGLERGRTAKEALNVITSLIAAHGQGGNCGFLLPSYYHNSFILADPNEAWVLETAGRQWAAEQVKDIRTISNGITIGAKWDLASEDLVAYAIDRRWCKRREKFHFGRCYSEPLHTRANRSARRQARTTSLLAAAKGKITVQTVMNVLRDHGTDPGAGWTPARRLADATVCWHAGCGPIGAYQTTGSLVSHLAPGGGTHFATGTSAPCTSVFKPFWLGGEMSHWGPVPCGIYDDATLFWRHEALHRAILRNYNTAMGRLRPQRDELERRFIEGAFAEMSAEERASYSKRCFDEAAAAEARWTENLSAGRLPRRQSWLYAMAWRGFNQQARMPRK